MRNFKIILLFSLFFTISCRKSTLVEVVDVPANPIVIEKSEGGKSDPKDVKASEGSFKMFQLPYQYKDLEPHFDAATIEIHYSKHHLACINGLNKAIVGTKYEIFSINDIFKNLNLSDTEVRNNAGGFYNHNLFWESIGPKAGGQPEGELLETIITDFGSYEEFQSQFTSTALKVFGSGWVWLVSDKTGKLSIVTTKDNDNPLMKNLGMRGTPILNLDMWEHAYYLKFQNKKRDYVNTFFSVINWKEVAKKYNAFPKISRTNEALTTSSTVTEIPVIEQEKPAE